MNPSCHHFSKNERDELCFCGRSSQTEFSQWTCCPICGPDASEKEKNLREAMNEYRRLMHKFAYRLARAVAAARKHLVNLRVAEMDKKAFLKDCQNERAEKWEIEKQCKEEIESEEHKFLAQYVLNRSRACDGFLDGVAEALQAKSAWKEIHS